MKRHLSILCFFAALLTSGYGHAQNFQWVRTIRLLPTPNPTSPYTPQFEPRIDSDQDGNVFLTGTFRDSVQLGNGIVKSTGGIDALLAVYDKFGVLKWRKNIGGSGSQTIADMKLDAFGNIYIAGQFRDNLIIGSESLVGSGTFIAKFTHDGSFNWVKRIDGYLHAIPVRLTVLANQDVVMAGTLAEAADFGCNVLVPNNPDPSHTHVQFLARYDQSGTCQWATSFIVTYLFDLTSDEKNNIIIAGGFLANATFGNHTLTANLDDGYVAKCDPNGNWLWARKLGGPGVDQALAVKAINSSTIILTGAFTSTATFETTTLTSMGASDIFLAKYSESGALTWVNQVGKGFGNQYGFALANHSDGRIFLTGSLIDNTQFGNLMISENSERSYFVGLDLYGQAQWALHTVTQQFPGDRGLEMVVSGDRLYTVGEFYGQGNVMFNNISVSANARDIYISKIILNNSVDPGGLTADSPGVVTGTREVPTLHNIILSPNPFQSTLSIDKELSLTIHFYDALGRLVLTSDGSSQNIDTSMLATGLYQVELISGSERQVRKMVKR